jgi:hypothetical protein
MFTIAIVLLHVTCAYSLDAAGLVESLLSPSGAQLLWILPWAAFFYALRIALFFVVPGVVIGNVILLAIDTGRDRYT